LIPFELPAPLDHQDQFTQSELAGVYSEDSCEL
jgi:hypothetical protein